MSDQRKTKKQLFEELEQERERSLALQEISNRLAGAHDTEEVLDLIVNEATRLVSTDGAFIRLLDGDLLVPRAATKSVAAYLAEEAAVVPTITVVAEGQSVQGHVMATQKPLVTENAREEALLVPAGRARSTRRGGSRRRWICLQNRRARRRRY